MNRWKIGFWIYFTLSIIFILYLFLRSNSYKVRLAFTRIDKIQTEQNLILISEIINNNDYSKIKILNEIKTNNFNKIQKLTNNKIELDRLNLLFINEKLIKVEIKKNEIDSLVN